MQSTDTAASFASSPGILLRNKSRAPDRIATAPTSLPEAAAKGDEASVSSMIAAGAFLSVRGVCGMTPLMLASLHGHIGVVEMLLAAGADPSVPNYETTAFALAMASGHRAVAEALRRSVASPAPPIPDRKASAPPITVQPSPQPSPKAAKVPTARYDDLSWLNA